MPEDLTGLGSELGTHDNDDGTQHSVVREPKLFRNPKKINLNRRSTWSLKNNEWTQVEDGTEWKNCPNTKFEDWTEKAVFYFWEEPENSKDNTACPVLQAYFESAEYVQRPRLADAFDEPVEEIVDETLRCVMVGQQALSLLDNCHVCGQLVLQGLHENALHKLCKSIHVV